MKAMILAAGRGERLRPLTDTLPKPLIEVRGETLIERHLRRLQAAGFAEVVVNVAWLAEQIKTRLGDGSRYQLRLHYSEEPAGALETGGGILKALPLLGPGPFLVVNADIYTEFPFAGFQPALVENDLAHLIMVPNPPAHTCGDFMLDGNGRLHAEGGPRLTYAGIGLHRPEFFEGCTAGRFAMLPLWQRAMRAGRVTGECYDGAWYDLGTPASLRALAQLSTG